MKKIFALVTFVMTILCSTPAFAMAVKRPADQIEQEDSNQNTPRMQSPETPDAPSSQRTKVAEGGDWNAPVSQELFPRDVSEEAPDYAGLVDGAEEPFARAPYNPDDFDDFARAFAETNEAPQ